MSLRANTVSQAAPVLVNYVLSFASTPIIVTGLGLKAYGIWAITGAISQYGSLLDLGVSKAVTRYIITYEATGDRKAQGEVMAVAVCALVAVGIVLTGLCAALAGPVAAALGHQPVGVMRWVMMSSVWVLSCILLSRVLAAYAIGLERMAAPNLALVLNAVGVFTASVIAVWVHPTLSAFATANVLAGVFGLLAMLTSLTVSVGPIPFARPSKATARELVSFGAKAQVVFVSDLIVFQSDKILLGVLVSPTAAGAYELGSRVAVAARAVAVLGMGALIPAMSVDATKGGLEAVRARYLHLTRRAMALGFGPLFLTAAAAPCFLVAWLDDVPHYTETVLIVLVLSSVANVGTGVASATAYAIAEPGIAAKASAITAGMNVVLAAVLAPIFGVWGVLSATAIATVVGAGFGLDLIHRRLDLPLSLYPGAIRGAAYASVVASAPAVLISVVASPAGRIQGVALSVLSAALFIGIYIAIGTRRGDLPKLRGSTAPVVS